MTEWGISFSNCHSSWTCRIPKWNPEPLWMKGIDSKEERDTSMIQRGNGGRVSSWQQYFVFGDFYSISRERERETSHICPLFPEYCRPNSIELGMDDDMEYRDLIVWHGIPVEFLLPLTFREMKWTEGKQIDERGDSSDRGNLESPSHGWRFAHTRKRKERSKSWYHGIQKLGIRLSFIQLP